MTHLALLLYTAAIAFFVYFLLNLRNRHSKPLPPGPKPWPIIGNLPHLGTMPHHSLAAMAKIYGPLMHLRLGSVHVVVAASSDVAAQFLKTHDANFSSRPPNSGAKHIAYNYQDMVFAPYGPRWRMLRKICSVHLFSVKALDDFRHVRQVWSVFLHFLDLFIHASMCICGNYAWLFYDYCVKDDLVLFPRFNLFFLLICMYSLCMNHAVYQYAS